MVPEGLFPGVHVDEVGGGARAIAGVATATTAFVGRTLRGPMNQAVHLRSFEDFALAFGPLSREAPLGHAVRDFFENGGANALVVRVVKGAPAESAPDEEGSDEAITDADVVGDPVAGTGIHALDAAGTFNLLCIPPLGRQQDVAQATWAAAAAYCVSRHALLVIDPPASWTAAADGGMAAVEAGVRALRAAVGADAARNAAAYFPRLRMPDPLGGSRFEDFAPCGAVAGIIARIDARRGVWKAPAGVEASLSGARGLNTRITEDQIARLAELGLNGLRPLAEGGLAVWGARTLVSGDSPASEWKYVPVRRLALFLEESLWRGLGWAVFEPNDELLWRRVRYVVSAFLLGLWRQGAFQGPSAPEAFFVKCDAETTAQADIDNGLMNVHVGFAPIRPAEFVLLRVQQAAGRTPA